MGAFFAGKYGECPSFPLLISPHFPQTDDRFDLVDLKIETLNKKISAVAADLSAHRCDAEAHHGVCWVKEG